MCDSTKLSSYIFALSPLSSVYFATQTHRHKFTHVYEIGFFFVGFFTLDANAILAVLVFVGVVRCTFNPLGINIITSLLAAQILERLGNSHTVLCIKDQLY